MNKDTDLRVAQLLCSRLCHDLVGPTAGVSAGAELIDEGIADSAEALALMGDSAAQLTRRLGYFRLAFGGAGETFSVDQIRRLAGDYFTDGRVSLSWPVTEPADALPLKIPGSAGKLLLNLLLLAIETLPRGGQLAVSLTALGNDLGFAVVATGSGATLADELHAAAKGTSEISDLTPRTVQAYLVHNIAMQIGAGVELSSGDAGTVQLAALVPGIA